MAEVAEKVSKVSKVSEDKKTGNVKANTKADAKLSADNKTAARTETAAQAKPASTQQTDTIDYNFIGSKEEMAESRTITSRTRLRNKVEDDIAEFLARGGTINEIGPDITADPPKKPENNYGSRAI